MMLCSLVKLALHCICLEASGGHQGRMAVAASARLHLLGGDISLPELETKSSCARSVIPAAEGGCGVQEKKQDLAHRAALARAAKQKQLELEKGSFLSRIVDQACHYQLAASG